MPFRAAIYARVSSAAQREAQTIEAQLKALPELCARNGWIVAGTYVDDGKSAAAGKLAARTGLKRLLVDATARDFDVVVVWDVDRLTRSEDQAERGAILGALAVAGIKVASLTGGLLDPRSSEGDLMLGVQAWAAADWLRKHRERVKAGKDRAIATGRKPAGPTPYGYLYERATGAWSVDEPVAELVREVFRRVAGGESCEALAIDLHERGVQRARGGRWLRERVWQIVTSATYRGEWCADKARGLVIAVPRIVDDQLWQAAQDALSEHGKRGLDRTRHIYLLQGLADCAVCNARIGIASAAPSHHNRLDIRGQARYVCAHRRRPPWGTERCALPYAVTAEIDGRLWHALGEILERRDLIERIAAARRRDTGGDAEAWRRDVAEMQRRLERLAAVEAAMLARFRRGAISEAAMDVELAAAGRERDLVTRQLDTARIGAARAGRAGDAVEGLEATAAALRGRLAVAAPEERRGLVRLLLAQRARLTQRGHVEAIVRLDPARAAGHALAAGYSHVAPDHAVRGVEFRLVA